MLHLFLQPINQITWLVRNWTWLYFQFDLMIDIEIHVLPFQQILGCSEFTICFSMMEISLQRLLCLCYPLTITGAIELIWTIERMLSFYLILWIGHWSLCLRLLMISWCFSINPSALFSYARFCLFFQNQPNHIDSSLPSI